MSAVTLADVKAHLQMTTTVNDAELQKFIDAAEAAISHEVGPLTPVTVVEKLRGGGASLVLSSPRVVNLTSVGYADGTAVTLADLDLDTSTGIVYWNYGTAGRFYAGPRGVTVTYQAGWASLPADLAQAVKELTRHLWETQRPNSTGPRPGFTDEVPVPGAFSSWPQRVRELIEPYTSPRVA